MDSLLFNVDEFAGPSPGQVAGQAVADELTPSQLAGKPRLRVPHRSQIEMLWQSLDEMLVADHPVRYVWTAVCQLNMARWLNEIKAVEGVCGRDTTDPRLLVALWVWATMNATVSAREIERLCETDLTYRWLCGGVTINHNLLSSFRSEGGEKWIDLMAQMIAALESEGLVKMQRVAQDGMKVRAHAGAGSFRRRPRLEQLYEEAKRNVKALERMAEQNPAKLARRQLAAQKRAAEDRERRLEEAIRNCEELQQQRDKTAKRSGRKPSEARASTTDPEARVMKFPDTGIRPGYNVQFSTDTSSGVIVGVDVVNAGNDAEQLVPMLEQIQDHQGVIPPEGLVDGGFASLETIELATALGCTVYAPLKDVKKQLTQGKDPYAPKPGDTPAIKAWRARMGTEAAKAIYQLRARTAEWVNALCRNRGLRQMPVRGLAKCRTVAVLYAITHNLLQGLKLRALAGANTA